MTIINNCADYARSARYIVARRCDSEWWFWGAYNDPSEAHDTALEIGGFAFNADMVEFN